MLIAEYKLYYSVLLVRAAGSSKDTDSNLGVGNSSQT